MNNPIPYELSSQQVKRHTLATGALGLACPPEADRLFAACLDGVYEVPLDANPQKLYTHRSYASGVICLHEINQLVSAGYDGALQWYDLGQRQVIRQIQAHSFWSWDLVRARHAPILASCTGQYLAGSYEYHPRASAEPSVRVYDADGRQLNAWNHGPPVQSVALNDKGTLAAAGNLMGEVSVWEVGSDRVADWQTQDFTAFGIIKSHCQIGGLYAAAFVPPSDELIVAGMGPMRDPMAGNGKQRFQRFAWRDGEARQVQAARDDEVGEGLMETLAIHPSGEYFVMAGRLRGGNWNTGLFDLRTGRLVHSLKTGARITKAVFSPDGRQLWLAGALKQSVKAEKEFGVIDQYELTRSARSAEPADA